MGIGVEAVQRTFLEDAGVEQRVGGVADLMEVGTVGSLVAVALVAEVRTGGVLVAQRVVLVFFPAMGVGTGVGVFAPVFVVHQEGLTLPQGTLLLRVQVVLRRPAEVLPVVAVVAAALVVFELVEWTEHCLEVEHVEVSVLGQQVDQRHLDLPHLMGEGTEHGVLTFSHPEGKLVTELGPVLDGPVELFYVVMAEDAVIALWTLLALLHMPADLGGVVTAFPSSVVLVVVEHAVLVVVGLFLRTRLGLEHLQVQLHHLRLLPLLFLPRECQDLLVDLLAVQLHPPFHPAQ